MYILGIKTGGMVLVGSAKLTSNATMVTSRGGQSRWLIAMQTPSFQLEKVLRLTEHLRTTLLPQVPKLFKSALQAARVQAVVKLSIQLVVKTVVLHYRGLNSALARAKVNLGKKPSRWPKLTAAMAGAKHWHHLASMTDRVRNSWSSYMTENSQCKEEVDSQYKKAELLPGLFLGLLVGGLVGLSVSPISGDVIAGLVAILAAFFGLGGKLPTSARTTGVRIVCFSIGVLVSAPGAILIRTHSLLAPTLEQRVEKYSGADLSAALAQELAIFDHTGLRLGSLATAPEPTLNLQNSGVAFSSESAAQCSSLQDVSFANPNARLEAMAQTNAPWGQAGQFGLSLPAADQGAFADYVHDLFCSAAE